MRKPLTNGDYAEAVFLVDANGNAASGGSGGGGDASATNQLTQIDKLTNIDTDLGSSGDSAASSDAGSFGIISLLKRLLSVKLDTPLSQIRDRLMPSGTAYSSMGSAVSGNLKGSAGNIYAFSCSNQTTSLVWFQLHDKATAPANGDTPVRSLPVFGATAIAPGLLLIGQDVVSGSGISFATGVGWAISSTPLTLTLTTANASNFITTVRYA